MKHPLKVVFGKEQVLKTLNNQILDEDELKSNVKQYEFNSIEEKLAFIKGINEAIGWTECCIPEPELNA